MHDSCRYLLEEARLLSIAMNVHIPNDLIGNIESLGRYIINERTVEACCIERALADYIFVVIDDADLKYIQG